MPPGVTLELGSLPKIHPKMAFLSCYGTSTIVRLSLDPILIPSGTMVRSVIVDWVARPGVGAAQDLTREIGWATVPEAITNEVVKWRITKNAHDITEEAAIGVMAMLLYDLERAEIIRVLPIGSGGDYLVAIQGIPPLQAESSGIRVDPKGYLSTQRLTEKCVQVLTKCSVGFASVTAFSHSLSQDVRCQLRYVARSNGAKEEPSKYKPVAKRSRAGKKQK